jgi:hypothetical protein
MRAEPTNPKIMPFVWTGLTRLKTSHGMFLYRKRSGATIQEARIKPPRAKTTNQTAEERKKPATVLYAGPEYAISVPLNPLPAVFTCGTP